MPRLKDLPPPPPTNRRGAPLRKFNWPAIAMSVRLRARNPNPADRWVPIAGEVLRAHAYQINQGQKLHLRPVGHYKAVSRGSGNYGVLWITYLGPELPGDSEEEVARLIDEFGPIYIVPDLAFEGGPDE
jgi:hypothetical protein